MNPGLNFLVSWYIPMSYSVLFRLAELSKNKDVLVFKIYTCIFLSLFPSSAFLSSVIFSSDRADQLLKKLTKFG